jgi:hypothetical protein
MAETKWRDRIEDGEAVSRESAGCGGREMTRPEDRRERRWRERGAAVGTKRERGGVREGSVGSRV